MIDHSPERARGPRRHRLRRLIPGPEAAATQAAACPRLPGLDALRSASMVAVVVAHAATAYVSIPIRGVPWAVYDRSRSFAFDAVVWSTISWAMPVFFALGVFAAAAIWSAKGPREFAKDRLRRIAAPAAIFGPPVLIATLLVWGTGWLVSGRAGLEQLLQLVFIDPEIRANTFGPAHLWFLEYLLLMLGAYYVVRSCVRLPTWARPPGGLILSWAGPLLVAVPTALILWLGHAVNGLDPIMDVRNRFVPNPIRWLHHGWFFVVGTWLFAARDGLPKLARPAPMFLLLALGAFVARAALLREDLVASLTGTAAWLSAGSGALFGWLSLFGSIGLVLRLGKPSPSVRYVAASSYWIYLTHFPIVGLVQVGLYPLPWPPAAKFLLALGLTLGFGLLSYQGLVRRTAVGRWLNGAKPTPIPPTPAGPHVKPSAQLAR
jgi:peptidoglycan/LPS O-acetylase OafA/YrhL